MFVARQGYQILELTSMFEPFKTFFTFLERKTKFLGLNQPKSMDMIGCCYTRKPNNNGFSSSSSSKLIDTNGDGKISTTELSEFLSSCIGYKKSIAAKETESMFSVLDSNGDGFVDLDEFMVVMNENDKKDNNNNNDDDEEENDYLMDAFLVFDTDKNGLISAKELNRVLMSLGFDQCSEKECKNMIKGVDKNGDGFVDFEEFKSMMKSRHAN
ncbi:probable calcium-binding protein CML23 isoform X3 [Arachis stenosperma]|uniref:probable calcium-binding protein CML23 isoform X3 n=1 Tax=Arachis stenosperma TaxID=217475 RepID=UPI0025ABF83D|nr:probable calcium-binding protein CML23 isoform X3 [Arachis stenosperma]